MADHGLLLTFGNRIDAALGMRIAHVTDALADDDLPGVLDVVPSYTTLLVILEPATADQASIVSRVNYHWSRIARAQAKRADARVVTIPVAYGAEPGPDLPDVARHAGMSAEEVIRRHAEASYQVGAIGFSPGFAFLIGLPPELSTPRRSSPRTAVPAGSIGIGGGQTGVYSLATPGGWNLIGRTALTLFDPERDPPSLLDVGDAVRFEPVGSVAVKYSTGRYKGDSPTRRHVHGDAIEVLDAGLQTSVQDLGRPGHGRLGVAPGGAVDRAALIAGNRLVGNADDAAGLECTLTGPHLRFLRPGRIAVTGAELGARLNGLRVPSGAARVVGAGDELTFKRGEGNGARAYLCLGGGIDVPVRLGSRSTDLMAGFGGFQGRALRMGDRLRRRNVGADVESQPALGPWPPQERPLQGNVFRVARGPQFDRFDDDAWKTFTTREFTVSSQSNRLGIRLDGPSILPNGGADIISEGIVTGAIQITGEGQPIVMLPSRATIGGYPKIATVVFADLDRLGQLRPGDRIRFEEVGYAGDIVIPRNEDS
ncbi:MAG: 5-oxoprolinase subunit PxpB [Chloroflexia bacterium]|nr:5-oxoprolinase subunit PxpB [Chloroflexia bacterium]